MEEIFKKMWGIMGKAAFFVKKQAETDVPEVPDVPEMPEGQRGWRERRKRAKNGSLMGTEEMERRGSPTAKPWGTVAMRDKEERDKEERDGGEGWRRGMEGGRGIEERTRKKNK